MYAITIREPGGPEALRWARVPDPQPAAGEVLIEVTAAGVNRADLLQARGGYPPPPGASDILGLECSGTVRAIPSDAAEAARAAGLQVGDEVCALLSGGGYAEQVAVPVGQVLPVPAGTDVTDAAGLPEVVCTVWSNLVMTAGLDAGQTVLIHGGSSGIGTMAIQIVRALGARALATASTEEKLAVSREWGATAINYRDDDFVTRVLQETDGRGVDVILDIVGADYLDRNVSALADGGRIVVIGLLGGSRGQLNLAALMAKRAGVIGTQLRSRPATGPRSKAEVVTAVRTHVWPLVGSGRIRPVIGRRVAMPEAGEAHRLLQHGEVTGKIVLERLGEDHE